GKPFQYYPHSDRWAPFQCFPVLGSRAQQPPDELGTEKRRLHLEAKLWFLAEQGCISQSERKEEADQVRMMRDNYESCAWTYSWLGPGSEISAGIRNVHKIDHLQQIIENHFEGKGEPVNNVRNVENLPG